MAFQLMTFGGGGVSLKGLKAATDYFIGDVYSTTSTTQTTAAAAKGIDFGSENGTYKTRVTCALKSVKKITVSDAAKVTDVEVGFMESSDNKTFTETMTLKIKLKDLNEARRTPIVFTPISTCSRYFCLRLKFTGTGASASADTVSDGMILATAEPDTY